MYLAHVKSGDNFWQNFSRFILHEFYTKNRLIQFCSTSNSLHSNIKAKNIFWTRYKDLSKNLKSGWKKWNNDSITHVLIFQFYINICKVLDKIILKKRLTFCSCFIAQFIDLKLKSPAYQLFFLRYTSVSLDINIGLEKNSVMLQIINYFVGYGIAS